MGTRFSHAVDEVSIRLSPDQAGHLAGTIRLELAQQWEEASVAPVPGREDVGKVRAALELYGDELEMLEWGEPAGEVELLCPRERLALLARNLLEGGEEWLHDPDEDTREARRRGQDMIATAEAIAIQLN
jgi:hypothetical protein